MNRRCPAIFSSAHFKFMKYEKKRLFGKAGSDKLQDDSVIGLHPQGGTDAGRSGGTGRLIK